MRATGILYGIQVWFPAPCPPFYQHLLTIIDRTIVGLYVISWTLQSRQRYFLHTTTTTKIITTPLLTKMLLYRRLELQ